MWCWCGNLKDYWKRVVRFFNTHALGNQVDFEVKGNNQVLLSAINFYLSWNSINHSLMRGARTFALISTSRQRSLTKWGLKGEAIFMSILTSAQDWMSDTAAWGSGYKALTQLLSLGASFAKACPNWFQGLGNLATRTILRKPFLRLCANKERVMKKPWRWQTVYRKPEWNTILKWDKRLPLASRRMPSRS